MNKAIANFNKKIGKIKPMHAVNNWPAHPKGTIRGNFETFSELGIPYVRKAKHTEAGSLWIYIAFSPIFQGMQTIKMHMILHLQICTQKTLSIQWQRF